MKHPKMKWQMWLVLAVLITGLVFFGSGQALAADCTDLGGTSGTECVIDAPVVRTGIFDITMPLRIASTGSITTGSGKPTPTLTLNVDGSFTMDAGAYINANNAGGCDGGRFGGTVTITATGAVVMATGSSITSNSCSGGSINITGLSADLDGVIESVGSITGTGAKQPPGGGPITIKASCDLTISDTGLVSSRGLDPGADLVHLEACTVNVYGKVESRGAGHAVPNSPTNHCYYQTAGFPSPPQLPVDSSDDPQSPRLDKPTDSTACVEIWGDRVTIDSTGTHKGEINADIIKQDTSQSQSWIDIYATTKVTITDGLGNNYRIPNLPPGDSYGFDTTFAVHANMHTGNGIGGLITIKSMGGDVEGIGDVAQADNYGGGADGGTVTVEAYDNVNLNGGTIYARGDFAETGGYGVGGEIFVRAFHGSLSWGNGVVDARPIGTDSVGTTLPAANRGVITLQDCLAPALVNVSTLTVPSNNNPVSSSVAGFSVLADNCAGIMSKPDYVILPPATCSLSCVEPAIKRGIKYNDLNKNGVRDGVEPVLSNWEIHLFGQPMIDGQPVGPAIHLHQFTDGSGKYEFVVPPGDYTVCETQQPGWTQSQPDASGADCSTHGGGFGYAITLVSGQIDEGNDFGNWKETIVVCKEDPKAVLTRTVAPAPLGGLPNHTSLQEAYDAAANGEVIGIFGKFIENVVLGDHDGIEGDKTLKITQCTSAQFTAADDSKPVFDITSTGNLTIVSPDSVGGSVGWRIATDGHHLKSIRANNAIGEGVLVLGSSNEISWNEIAGNAVGMRVEGDGNDLRGGTVQKNAGDGVWFTSTATNNVLQGATIQYNGGNGVSVDGTWNTIKSNSRLNLNTLSGLAASGPSNTIQSNTADQNGAAGFTVSGPGNLVRDNKASKNSGLGFDVSGGTSAMPNRLRGNVSNNGSSAGSSENLGFEFQLFGYVKNDSGGNKADGISIPKTTVPLKCSQFPVTNATKNFTAVYACGDGTD